MIANNKIPLLKCEWHERYLVHSLQSPSASHPLDIAISIDDVSGMERMCGITKVIIGDRTFVGNPFVGDNDAQGIARFKDILSVGFDTPLWVESFSVAYKTLIDSESFELNLPSKGVELEVEAIGCNLKVRSHIMHAEAAYEGWKHGKNGVSHWHANCAMLPHQGISLSWFPA